MKAAIISLKSKSSEMIFNECKKYFDEVDSLNIKSIEISTGKGGTVLYNGEPLKDYDCIYCRGSYKYAFLLKSVTETLKGKCYLPIPGDAFVIGHNKFLTLIELQKLNIDCPKTYLVATTKSAKNILNKIHYPVIIKTLTGTHGKGVMSADSFASASSVLDALEVFKQEYIIQEYIETDSTDIRAIVVGDKVVAAMRRKAVNGEIRANIHAGGVGSKVELDENTEHIAVRAAKALNVDICAVDILEGTKPRVLEINMSPGLSGITKATKLNVAKMIAKFLFDKAKEFKNCKGKENFNNLIKDLEQKNEIFTNIDIKLGKIRLPKIVTKLSDFGEDDDVCIRVCKGKIVVKKHDIKKE